ncbi:MAG: SRPBCC family protein [Phycisphaerales bacterium]|nr:SRPBCC family protein [Phycisphaerales bacterium]
MKPYTLSVDIDAPRDLVVELFNDPDNLPKWQPGFVSWTLIEGKQGEPGAKAAVVFEHRGRRIDMTETVTENSLPDAMNGRYDWGRNFNTVDNRFIELDADNTRWELTCAYTLNSIGMKFMGMLMGKKFQSQHLVFMEAFKAFCEEGTDVRDGSSG